jgi:hypothetical protein
MKKEQEIYDVTFTRNGMNGHETIYAERPQNVSKLEFRDSIVHSLKTQIGYKSSEGILENIRIKGIDY